MAALPTYTPSWSHRHAPTQQRLAQSGFVEKHKLATQREEDDGKLLEALSTEQQEEIREAVSMSPT